MCVCVYTQTHRHVFICPLGSVVVAMDMSIPINSKNGGRGPEKNEKPPLQRDEVRHMSQGKNPEDQPPQFKKKNQIKRNSQESTKKTNQK